MSGSIEGEKGPCTAEYKALGNRRNCRPGNRRQDCITQQMGMKKGVDQEEGLGGSLPQGLLRTAGLAAGQAELRSVNMRKLKGVVWTH
jgi:hypothetical protein